MPFLSFEIDAFLSLRSTQTPPTFFAFAVGAAALVVLVAGEAACVVDVVVEVAGVVEGTTGCEGFTGAL